MRVIAGKARRITLKTVEGLSTRPTTDRIKETLFNMLQDKVYDSCFLDLFAGSGAIGIEALSRGARKAVFVENAPKAADCIRENLKACKLQEDAKLLTISVIDALPRLEREGAQFDIIFMDPPYNMELEKQVLSRLSGSSLISKDTLIIVEASKETSMDYVNEFGFTLIKEKTYKTNKHLFLSLE